MPLFALKYFTRRAPDFFDWRSGVWEFGTDSQLLKQESLRILIQGNVEQYVVLSSGERTQKILEIQELIDDLHGIQESNTSLFFELGNLFATGSDYPSAIASYDKALKFKPHDAPAWNNRGVALGSLGRYEEEIASYDKALEFKPDKDEAWNNRGVALGNLGQFDDAITSYDKALEFKPDYDQAWTARGATLGLVGRFEEAMVSFDKALELKPDDPNIFYNKACCFALQANSEAAVASLKIAISLAPEEYREMAKTDSDFDLIRDNKDFQALLTS